MSYDPAVTGNNFITEYSIYIISISSCRGQHLSTQMAGWKSVPFKKKQTSKQHLISQFNIDKIGTDTLIIMTFQLFHIISVVPIFHDFQNTL